MIKSIINGDIMILNSILNSVSKVLGWVINKIPDVNIDISGFSESLSFLLDKTESINKLLPIKEAMILVGIGLSIKLAMLVFWGAMRVINLLRGAG